jgi:hypothetical protein
MPFAFLVFIKVTFLITVEVAFMVNSFQYIEEDLYSAALTFAAIELAITL